MHIRRMLTLLVLSFGLMLSSLAAIPFAGAATGSPVTGYAGKCLDNYQQSTTNGNKIDLWTCNGSAAQDWTYNSSGHLVNSNGKCLNDAGYGGSGTKQVLWTCGNYANEDFTHNSANQYVLSYNGLCLNDPGYSKTDGTQQIIWACGSYANEDYSLPATPAPPPVTSGRQPSWAPNGSLTPVFDDEFNGTSPDTSKWALSWQNNREQMNNVWTPPANVSESGGTLNLKLVSSSSGALVDTDPNFAGKGFQYGNGYDVEARVYFPGSGSTIYNWPAWWTDGQQWPQDGETDIAEGLGDLTSNYHSSNGTDNGPDTNLPWGNQWHTYGYDREAGMNYVYWDGKLVRSYKTYDSGSPQYLLLNVGSGHTASIPSTMKVDWVEVWKK